MSFDQKTPVVLLTGASGALGSAIAAAYSEQGATLVLQDIPEAKVALEALAQSLRTQFKNTISTSYINIRTDPAALVNFTIQTFGYMTILINNAGFLRDASFTKMTDQQWDDIIDIHLTTPYKLTKAAWPIFNQQKFGRVVFVTSAAGIFGNFGQANYSAAKAGVTGLTRTLSLEGKKNGIMVNAIAPFAESAMTKSAFPKEMLAPFSPREIAPVVLFLTASNSTITGEVLQCGGGFVAKTVTYTTPGAIFKTGDSTTTPIQTKVSQLQTAWTTTMQTLPTLPAPKSDSQGQGVFSKTADVVLAEMMRLVKHNVDELNSQGNIVASSSSSSSSPQPKSTTASPSQPQSQPTTTTKTTTTTASGSAPTPTGLKADVLIAGLQAHIDDDIIKQAGVVIGFEIMPGAPQPRVKGAPAAASAAAASGPKRTVTIDLKNGKGGVLWDKLTSFENKKPDAVLIIHDDLLAKLFLQEVEAQSLYLTGKIKVRGDIAKAMKFEQVLKSFEHKVSVKELLAASQARL